MNQLAYKMSGFFSNLPDTLKRRRLVVWLLFFLITLFLAAGLPKVQTDGSVFSYFERNDPVRKAYDQFREVFGGDENLYIVYEAKDGDIFSDTSLKALQGIQEELLNYRLKLKPGEASPLDHIEDVTTLINVSYLESANDTLISRDFIDSQLPLEATQREALRELAGKEKNIADVFFSNDSKYGGIVIETNFNAIPASFNDDTTNAMDTNAETDFSAEFSVDSETEESYSKDESPLSFKENVMVDYVPFMQAVKNILNHKEYSKHLKFYPVGAPAFMDYAYVMILGEMGMILLGMILLAVVVTGIIYRSISAMVWTVLIMVFSLIWTMGAVGWSGIVMPDLIIIVVFFVITASIADTIHILSGYLFFRQHNLPHEDALRSVFRKSGFACFITSITTATGFSSMLFVPIVSMQKIGGTTAVGVICAFCITVIILPLMLNIWSPVPKKKKEEIPDQAPKLHLLQSLLRRIETVGINKPITTMIFFFCIIAILATGINRIRVESSNIEILRPETSIRKAFDLADEHMAGTDSLEVLVNTGQENGMKDPRVVKIMADLQKKIETDFKDTVSSTYSIADVTKDAYQALNNNAPEAYIIPQDPDVLSQTLFLFDNADPDDRRELISDDYSIGRISIYSESLDTTTGMKLMNTVDEFSKKNLKKLQVDFPDAKIIMTGIVALRMKMDHLVSQSQLIGFGFTFCVISVVLLLMFGSLKIGLLAIIPNLFPIVVVAGVMGYFKIPLEIHTLLVIPIIIGTAVDDTIHFLTHFQIERQQHEDSRTAIIMALREVGQAISFTSIILSIGFLLFIRSNNMGFVHFGILNAVAITAALIADLFLLPAILSKHFPSKYQLSGHSVEMKPNVTPI